MPRHLILSRGLGSRQDDAANFDRGLRRYARGSRSFLASTRWIQNPSSPRFLNDDDRTGFSRPKTPKPCRGSRPKPGQLGWPAMVSPPRPMVMLDYAVHSPPPAGPTNRAWISHVRTAPVRDIEMKMKPICVWRRVLRVGQVTSEVSRVSPDCEALSRAHQRPATLSAPPWRIPIRCAINTKGMIGGKQFGLGM